MPYAQKLDTHHQALTLNLDPSTFGSFAEIGAGQEVARWFLLAGGASGAVAKTISAYDKDFSDDLHGSGSRYLSKQRLEAQLQPGAPPNDVVLHTNMRDSSNALQQQAIGILDMVKMNTHGSEYDVLLSTDPKLLKRCRRIAVQYHELPAEIHLGKNEIFRRLNQIGFRLVADDDTHRGSGLAVFASA